MAHQRHLRTYNTYNRYPHYSARRRNESLKTGVMTLMLVFIFLAFVLILNYLFAGGN